MQLGCCYLGGYHIAQRGTGCQLDSSYYPPHSPSCSHTFLQPLLFGWLEICLHMSPHTQGCGRQSERNCFVSL